MRSLPLLGVACETSLVKHLQEKLSDFLNAYAANALERFENSNYKLLNINPDKFLLMNRI